MKIILLCIVGACVYGIVHDQITARISVEYFTIGHPIIVDTTSPTVLGLVWGVVATWWMGLILGVPIALVSRVGRFEKLSARELVKPIGLLLMSMGCVALVSGVVGHVLAREGRIELIGWPAIHEDRHTAFLTAWWAHSASYYAGVVGGVVLLNVLVLWRRRRTVSRAQGSTL